MTVGKSPIRGSLPNSAVKLGLATPWLFAIIGAHFPMFPIYLDELGVAASDIAYLASFQTVVALLVLQLYGYLADTRFTRRQMLLTFGLFSVLVEALFPRIPNNLWLLSLGMVGLALFMSQRIMLFNSLMLDSEGGEHFYGRVRVLGSLSFAVVAPAVGWLAATERFTPAVMWPAMIVFELLFAITLIPLIDARPCVEPGKQRIGFWRAQRMLLANPLMRIFLVFTLLYQIVGVPGHMLQTKLLVDIGSTALFATGCLAFAAVVEMSCFFWGNQILLRIRLMPLLATIPVALSIRYLMIFVSPTPWMIFASNFFHLITFGLGYMCGVLFIHREAPAELKSSGQTLYGLVFSLVSGVIGNAMVGGLLHWLRTGWGLDDAAALRLMYGVGAAVALVAFAAWVPMKREYERKHQVSGFWVR